jgi:hypothetical protein
LGISICNVVLSYKNVKTTFQEVILFFQKSTDPISDLMLTPTKVQPGQDESNKDYGLKVIMA